MKNINLLILLIVIIIINFFVYKKIYNYINSQLMRIGTLEECCVYDKGKIAELQQKIDKLDNVLEKNQTEFLVYKEDTGIFLVKLMVNETANRDMIVKSVQYNDGQFEVIKRRLLDLENRKPVIINKTEIFKVQQQPIKLPGRCY